MDTPTQKQVTRKQHIVPQSYLKLFATETRPDHFMIGVGEYRNSEFNFYKNSIANVGYIEYYYEVNQRSVNFWENRFAKEIEPYCTNYLPDLLRRIQETQKHETILTLDDKIRLGNHLCAQSLRVPAWIDREGSRISEQTIRNFKAYALTHIPPYYSAKGYQEYCKAVLRANFTNDEIKDIILFSLMDSPNKQERIDALLEKSWIIYCSPTHPYFLTSDNPVVRYNPVKKSFRNGDNGLKNIDSEIFFPLSPSVLLRIVSSSNHKSFSSFDNCKIELTNTNESLDFILYCNQFQQAQYYQHFFLPPALCKAEEAESAKMTDKIPSVQQNEVVNCLDTKGGGVNCKEQTVDKRTGKLKKV